MPTLSKNSMISIQIRTSFCYILKSCSWKYGWCSGMNKFNASTFKILIKKIFFQFLYSTRPYLKKRALISSFNIFEIWFIINTGKRSQRPLNKGYSLITIDKKLAWSVKNSFFYPKLLRIIYTKLLPNYLTQINCSVIRITGHQKKDIK